VQFPNHPEPASLLSEREFKVDAVEFRANSPLVLPHAKSAGPEPRDQENEADDEQYNGCSREGNEE
jgi:hypothetical protein